MKSKSDSVQELCRKLKIQLEELSTSSVNVSDPEMPAEERSRRTHLMEQLKKQLAELSR